MDRQIVKPGQIPLDTDLLSTNRNTMVALAKLAEAMLGTGSVVDGFACAPTSPASMQVDVAGGTIFSLQNIDSTAYGALSSDTADQVVKTGIRLAKTTLSAPAPGTSGQSINYLVQVAFSEVDGSPVVRPYYNASNPSVAWSGPAGAGTPDNTVRSDIATVTIKAGTAATTGSQTTPSPDAGNIGLWVVTVANGASTITSGNISQLVTAPFLPFKLPSLTPGFSRILVFTAAGYNPGSFTVPAGVTKMRIRLQAPGGGGGGNSGGGFGAGGGGPGGYAEDIKTVTPGAVHTVTIGATGAAGTSGGGNGGNGGTTSFGALMSATGGSGGVGAGGSPGGGGVGGAGTGGSINTGPGGGSAGIGSAGGPGGPSPLGVPGGSSTGSAYPAGGYGAGGSGAGGGGSAYAGGAGAPAVIIVEY